MAAAGILTILVTSLWLEHFYKNIWREIRWPEPNQQLSFKSFVNKCLLLNVILKSITSPNDKRGGGGGGAASYYNPDAIQASIQLSHAFMIHLQKPI